MIIDFHTHTFPEKIAAGAIEKLKDNSHTESFSDGTVSGLSAQLTQNGVDLAIVLPVVTNPVKTRKINDSAARINETTASTHVFSFGGMHPDTPDYKAELRHIQALGLKGIKLHPAYQRVDLDDIRYERIIGYANELGLLITVHGGLDIGIEGTWSTPRKARKVLDDVRPNKLIMAHTGGWQMWDDVIEFLCGQNVYLDTSFSMGNYAYQKNVPMSERAPALSREKFVEIVRLHGADRILFGTDSPWGSHAEQLRIVRSLPLDEEEKRKILGENGKELLNL